MPVGYLLGIAFVGICLALQLVRVPRNPLVGVASFWTSMAVNEQPHWFALFLLASTALAVAERDVHGAGWVLVAVAAFVVAGLIYLLARAFPSRGALAGAIASLDPAAPERIAGRKRHTATLLAPMYFGRRGVERIGDIAYGPAGKRNLLDVYRPRRGEVTGPTLIYLHGGGFTSGAKRREGQFALYRLAARGWFCVSANYGLSPDVQFPQYVVDAKRVIAWVRGEGAGYGADSDRLLLAGSSAGGHIAATAGLTPDEPLLQPGFEEVDTSVSGVVGLYGYYGNLNYGRLRPEGPLPSSPRDLVHADAPPFLLIHGDRDTVVPVANARRFAQSLERVGATVALAELPGAQHTFDLLRSVRTENSADAIEDFASWIGDRQGA